VLEGGSNYSTIYNSLNKDVNMARANSAQADWLEDQKKQRQKR